MQGEVSDYTVHVSARARHAGIEFVCEKPQNSCFNSFHKRLNVYGVVCVYIVLFTILNNDNKPCDNKLTR